MPKPCLKRTFSQNVNLSDPILSRFDLMCVLRDESDPVQALRLTHMVTRSLEVYILELQLYPICVNHKLDHLHTVDSIVKGYIMPIYGYIHLV